MLSWSGKEQGIEVDLSTLTVGIPHAQELLDFAGAAASPAKNSVLLESARGRLVDAIGEAAMIDAAAVVANFEMMTRLAEGTGAVLNNPASVRAGSLIGADAFRSRR